MSSLGKDLSYVSLNDVSITVPFCTQVYFNSIDSFAEHEWRAICYMLYLRYGFHWSLSAALWPSGSCSLHPSNNPNVHFEAMNGSFVEIASAAMSWILSKERKSLVCFHVFIDETQFSSKLEFHFRSGMQCPRCPAANQSHEMTTAEIQVRIWGNIDWNRHT